MLRLLIIFSFILTTISNASFIKPLVQFGYNGGGDELVTVEHEYSSNYTIDAADAYFIEGGMAIENPMANFETQLFIGYKFDTDSASNGDITWSMIPFNALGFFRVQNWKFGGGLTYHISPKLRSTFDNARFTDEFENALGAIVQIQYEPLNFLAIGLKGTFIEYELKDDNSKKTNGNSLGFVLTFKFGGTQSRYR